MSTENEVIYSSDDEDDKVYDTYSNGGNEILFDSGSQDTIYSANDDEDDSGVTYSGEVDSLNTEEVIYSSDEEEDSDIYSSPSMSQAAAETDSLLYTPSREYDPDAITKEFFLSKNSQTSIGMFMKSRYGKSGIKQDGETNDEYAERFFNKMRWMQNNMASTGSGLAWLHGADETTKNNFAMLYTAFDDMPSFYEKGGGNSGQGMWDTIASVVFDPANVATLGIATGFKILGGRLAAKTVLSQAIKSNAGRIGGAVAVEGILGAMQAGNIQSLEKEANLRTELDWDIIMGMGVLSAGTAGLISGTMFYKGLRDATYKEKVAQRIDKERKKLGLRPKDLSADDAGTVYNPSKALNEQVNDVATIFDEALDINRANAKNPRTRISVEALQEAKVVVATLIDAIPSLAPRHGEQVSTAFHRAFYTLDMADAGLQREINDEVINKGLTEGMKGHNFTQAMSALKHEMDDLGIGVGEFGVIADVDASTAGKILNQYSQLAKVMRLLEGETPDVKDAVALAKREDIINGSFFLRVVDQMGKGIHKADRVRRAMMTSQPATTARNIVSGTAAVTFHIASRMLRNTVAGVGHAAKAVNPMNDTQLSFRGTVSGMGHIFGDSFSILGDIFSHGQNRELVDLVLGNNKILHHKLLRTTQEAGTNSLPKAVLFVNSLNIAQDQFLRTGVFMNSVNRQMSELLGIKDVTAYLASGKKIPTAVANIAVDDALDITFANVPKNSIAAKFVGLVETLPFFPIIGTGAFPFARFMANAVSFQFRYSPFNVIGGVQSILASKSISKQALGDGQREMIEAQRKFADASVGAGAIFAAYMYRKDKQDTTTYDEMIKEDGSTVGISAIFPLPFYLMLGDLFVKYEEGTLGNVKGADIITAVTGFQQQSTKVNYFLDNFISIMEDSGIAESDVGSEKMADFMGKYIGELAGQYVTPIKLGRDIVAAFDEEQNLRRDANIVTSKGSTDRFVESFLNKATSNLPYQLQELYRDKPLPAYRDAARGGDQYNVAPALTQITGMKIIPARTEIQNELLTKGIKPYLMLSPTGDKQADALIRKYMPKFMNDILTPIINSSYYKSKSLIGKKNLLMKAKALVIKYSKERAQEDFAHLKETQGYNPAARAKWIRLPKNKRKEVNEMWMNMYGTSIDDANAYEAGASLASSLPGL
tara:strand:+ start:1979 stop:5473 length:3495 start_codon:yes stop_codon:yes gene_type:complete